MFLDQVVDGCAIEGLSIDGLLEASHRFHHSVRTDVIRRAIQIDDRTSHVRGHVRGDLVGEVVEAKLPEQVFLKGCLGGQIVFVGGPFFAQVRAFFEAHGAIAQGLEKQLQESFSGTGDLLRFWPAGHWSHYAGHFGWEADRLESLNATLVG